MHRRVIRALAGGTAVARGLVDPRWLWTSLRGTSKVPSLVFVDLILLLASMAVGVGVVYGIVGLTELGLIGKEMMTTLFSMLCPLITIAGFLAPIPIVVDGLCKPSVQNLPVLVFQVQAICNILALSYAVRIKNVAVLVTNMVGLAFQVLYLAVHWYVVRSNSRWLAFALQGSLLLNTALYVGQAFLPLTVLGYIIIIFNLCLCVVPLQTVPEILKTRNPAKLPAGMTAMATITNGMWLIFGLLLGDEVVYVPSFVGYASTGFQALLLLWCNQLLPFDLGFLKGPCLYFATSTAPSREAPEAEVPDDKQAS